MNKEIEKAIEFIKDLMSEKTDDIMYNDKIGRTILTALEAQQADRWIPITNSKLPESNDGDWAVFIIPSYFGAGDNKTTARYFKEQGIIHESGWTNKSVARATYWMPLPEPWKEEQS